MKRVLVILIFITIDIMAQNNIYDITLESIDNEIINLNDYRGKNILFVNVASFCGYTKQYSDLQKLYERFDDLEVIGLPCNQFLFQEPFGEDSIKSFCSINYGITFPMTKKINVKGKDQHELYKWLTKKELNGKKNSKVKWNFQKYLISKEGELIDFFTPTTKPLSEDILKYLN
tara:strand:- start:1084 stop:1605 length:522 start_codon:yes stop_codon:yes gene_type:complete